jgi:tetratricopeptide (TPR) repeat protein
MLHAGIALSARGAYARAAALLEESALQCRQAGADHLQARTHNTLAGIYRELGQGGQADEQYARAVELATRSGFSEALAHAWVGQAEQAMDAGNLSAAHTLLDQARPIVHDPLVFYSWRIRMRWELVRGRLALLEGRSEAALEAAQHVAQDASTTASLKYTVLAHGLRAEVLGTADNGLAEARAALDVALRLDAPPLVWGAASMLARLASGSEAEHARQMARTTVEAIAASLPEALGCSLVAHASIGP